MCTGVQYIAISILHSFVKTFLCVTLNTLTGDLLDREFLCGFSHYSYTMAVRDFADDIYIPKKSLAAMIYTTTSMQRAFICKVYFTSIVVT